MASLKVNVHPVVLFNIVDAYERRNLDQPRVIGTLLGSTDKSGVIEITNSFVVIHRETNGEVAMDIDVPKELFELYRKVNANETIVGWFAVGEDDVNEYSVLIHDYYSRETNNPIHLTVTPTKDSVDIKAYVSTPIGVPTKMMGTLFSPIPHLVTTAGYDTEMVGLKSCLSSIGIPGSYSSANSEIEMLVSATKRCSDTITQLINFIDEAILSSGKSANPAITAKTNEIGRQLMSMVEGLSPFGDDEEKLNTNIKDLLMVIYLCNLSKTQLMLNEKLSLL